MSVNNRNNNHNHECEGYHCNNSTAETFFCHQCDSHFCNRCWSRQASHLPGKLASDGLPHEKVDIRIATRLEKILNSSNGPREQDALHQADETTIWFGIERNYADVPAFQDYERYSTLMLEHMPARHEQRYPQLVSFVGQTGSGKSTLVKLLINHPEMRQDSGGRLNYPAPVVGSTNDDGPTSGGVHLYADPGTSNTNRPILYADCEGLQGGESLPSAARSTRNRGIPSALRGKIGKTLASSIHIQWANSPETKKREYAVMEFYPRLLYTFSDVVVFVLRTTSTFELVLDKLISWAALCLEKSLNQPALPHAVIASNFTEVYIDSLQWDAGIASKKLMSDFEDLIGRVERFRDLADYWIRRGKSINTVHDLLLCYYSSVTIVRLPVKGRYMRMHSQVEQLHAVISSNCRKAHEAKRRIRMLANSDDLQVYLRAAFMHFSQKLDVPFNFVEVALNHHPGAPKGFSGNMLQLAIIVKDSLHFDAERIFVEIARMVASCIFMDIARHALLGNPRKLLDECYILPCNQTLRIFCSHHWPCSFRNRRGRCVNTQSGHSKGHQSASAKVIAVGAYESDFNYEVFEQKWRRILRKNLIEIHQNVQERTASSQGDEKTSASIVHLKLMNSFYSTLGSAEKFKSHTACFGCLREYPEHPLPCGHVLCALCIESYSKPQSSGQILLENCPLHQTDKKWLDPWQIRLKPHLAGLRVLALDGGGMRGIAELEVLKAIQNHLPRGIPVHMFFDLIVGTSTGGIIALGLAKGWSIDRCIEKFRWMSTCAFTPRLFHSTFFELAEALHHGGQYKTRPLTDELKCMFSDDRMFGGGHRCLKSQAKVAITSTTETGQQPVIFTNYNREQITDQQPDYRFERPNKPGDELRLWEVARATSAAPGYFKPFIHERTSIGYLDGALYYNNPARVANMECKFIWPDTVNHPPDILLSIGTGHDAKSAASKIQDRKGYVRSRAPKQVELPHKKKSQKIAQLGYVRRLFKGMKNRVDNMTNSELAWHNFSLDVFKFSKDQFIQTRYQRINPDLGSNPPRMDRVDRIEEVQTKTHNQLRNREKSVQQIREISSQLVASSFYFEKYSTPRAPGEKDVRGAILCKFCSGESEIRHLGRYLRDKTTASFQPHFTIAEDSRSTTEKKKIEISQRIISHMTKQADFRLDDIIINVSGEEVITDIDLSIVSGHKFPISGFPRALLQKSPKSLHTSLLEGAISHPGLEASPFAVISTLSEADDSSDHLSDHSYVEHQLSVSDYELKSKPRNSRYKAFSTLRRADMVQEHTEFSSDGEDW